jgi:type II secretory pathway pseudopilin PulG
MHRRGITIVELLVSLSIVALIFAMIAPAVQSARETARKLECLNHLKQFGAALNSFETANRRFPGIDSEASVQPISMGLGPIAYEHRPLWLSVHSQLIGHLEKAATAKKIDRSEPQPSGYTPPTSALNASLLDADVPVFKCPSDAVPRGGNSYRVSVANHSYPIVVRGSPDAAFAWDWAYVGDAQPAFVGWQTAHFLDGLSHTAFASERIVGDGDDGAYQSACDVAIRAMASVPQEPPDAVAAACDFGPSSMSGHVSHLGWTWLYAGFGHTQYNHVLTPNSRKPDVGVSNGLLSIYYGAITARSFHKGGVNLLLGDGSAKFVADSIDQKVWRALATIAGNEVVSDL